MRLQLAIYAATLSLSLVPCFRAPGQDVAAARSVLSSQAQSIVRSRCLKCHGQQQPAGQLRLDTLSADLASSPQVAQSWSRVLEMVADGEMPPADARQLRPKTRKLLEKSLTDAIEAAMVVHSRNREPGVPRRLNRFEYANTMRDLLDLDMDYARDLPADPLSNDGFRNDGSALQMSAEQLATYLETARRALSRTIVSGAAPQNYEHRFTESNVAAWHGQVEFSNRLGRDQQFIAKMVNDYPEEGDFLIRVTFTAELVPDSGFPVLEVSLGYRPDTQILFREVGLVEISQAEQQVIEFRGRLEEFPLPVRGQGKFPGLVIRLRNAYDDRSPRQKGVQSKEKDKKWSYPDEPQLPKLLIQTVEFQGPVLDSWPPPRHRQILFESALRETDEAAYVAEVLRRFIPRCFRRPVQARELDSALAFYQTARERFPNFEEAVRETLAMVLISPEFLYLMEPTEQLGQPADDWELASRLSYFLWSTMPDDQLRDLAERGQLHEPEVLRQQVDRLLRDSRSLRFIEQFTGQWLQLDKLERIAVNRERFPKFDETLKADMQRETHHFFKLLMDHDLSALNLLASDFVVLNERMAKHYNIEGVWGSRFRRVTIAPEDHRGGLLSQASILLANSTGRDSHPIRRAVWVRDRLLNDPPAPPPADVPPLNQADRKFLEMSVRQQLEIHRNTESCAQCHANLDPWGIALENFDAIGLWRGGNERQPIDALAELPDGQRLQGVDELKHYLMESRAEQFARALVVRLLTYAVGRRLEFSDQPTIDQLTQAFVADQYRLAGLVKNITASKVFLTK